MSVGYYITYNSLTVEYCNVSVDHSPRFTSAGSLESYDYSYRVSAWMRYTSTANMVTAIAAIRTALNTQKKDLVIYDTAGVTAYSFGASDCNGDGPYVKYSFPETAGNSFRLDMEFSGNVPPGGSGTDIVDDYSDDYSADATGRYTWTRTGTRRNSSAWTDQDDALDDADPAPSESTWEFVSKTGKLDEDLKKLEYTFVYQEFWEKQSAEWKESDYTINITRNGATDDITFSGTVKPSFAIGGAESLEDRAISWAEGKMPSGATITNIGTSLDKRAGSCAVSMTAIRATTGDLVEETYSDTTNSHTPFVIHRPLNGGTPKADICGAPIIERHVRGRLVGLTGYPDASIPDDAWDSEKTKENPQMTVSGGILFPMSYSYSVYLNVDMNSGGGGGGGGAGGGGIGGGGQPAGGGGLSVKLDDLWNGGLINAVAGGIAGTRKNFATKGLINSAAGGLARVVR